MPRFPSRPTRWRRFVAGAFLVPHGLWKLFGITGSQEEMIAFFQAIGLEPAVPLMIAVGVVEVVGGACVAVGFLTRPAALAAAITTGDRRVLCPPAARLLCRGRRRRVLGAVGVLLLMIAVRGGGRISVDALIGREF